MKMGWSMLRGSALACSRPAPAAQIRNTMTTEHRDHQNRGPARPAGCAWVAAHRRNRLCSRAATSTAGRLPVFGILTDRPCSATGATRSTSSTRFITRRRLRTTASSTSSSFFSVNGIRGRTDEHFVENEAQPVDVGAVISPDRFCPKHRPASGAVYTGWTNPEYQFCSSLARSVTSPRSNSRIRGALGFSSMRTRTLSGLSAQVIILVQVEVIDRGG